MNTPHRGCIFADYLPDKIPDKVCRSVGSRMNRASSGRFPLNMVYPLIKHFDGANDGLVSVESMK